VFKQHIIPHYLFFFFPPYYTIKTVILEWLAPVSFQRTRAFFPIIFVPTWIFSNKRDSICT